MQCKSSITKDGTTDKGLRAHAVGKCGCWSEWCVATNALEFGRSLIRVAITATGTNFSLTAERMSYLFHVDSKSGDLISDHFGGPATDFTPPSVPWSAGWNADLANVRREFPDFGRSDPRLPAIHIGHSTGDTVSAFRYQSHNITQGKSALPGLPATFGGADNVTTLIVQLHDNVSDVSAALSYSIFPEYNAIARSFTITNHASANGSSNGTSSGSGALIIERAASFSTDFPNMDLEMIEPYGDWSHEFNTVRRKVDFGRTS
jgi:alpha-galactosidase